MPWFSYTPKSSCPLNFNENIALLVFFFGEGGGEEGFD